MATQETGSEEDGAGKTSTTRPCAHKFGDASHSGIADITDLHAEFSGIIFDSDTDDEDEDESSKICQSCEESKFDFRFPDAPDNSSCAHVVESCWSCWEQWIETQLASQTPDKISCIQCRTTLTAEDIRAYATPVDYQRYLDLCLRTALSADPSFHFCKDNSCESGQFHDTGEIFCCTACSHKHCVECQSEWHEGKTCESYQAEKRHNEEKAKLEEEELRARRVWEDEASEDTNARTTKACPGSECGKRIEKNDGCEHMICRQCDHEFCWLCLADYKAIRKEGNHAHEKDCPHWREPP
ncbi:hypothetical protein CKM354_000511000 [Cercospora kikuchii]|uniref:RBR-type E3 ubiquitin transferase n=1 Tax=Cercospora kikuchii TaxID=84275 RepID=A0A9P3FGF9_9PEZI|nr:uncharacterized protein CKM354_000511000 [Cercospora kikuchii]GIZ41819.1 hypothetical protein CKM354_000511000 [Cercospora kikuchii]